MTKKTIKSEKQSDANYQDAVKMKRANQAMVLLELLTDCIYDGNIPEKSDWGKLSKEFNQLIKEAYPDYYSMMSNQIANEAKQEIEAKEKTLHAIK